MLAFEFLMCFLLAFAFVHVFACFRVKEETGNGKLKPKLGGSATQTRRLLLCARVLRVRPVATARSPRARVWIQAQRPNAANRRRVTANANTARARGSSIHIIVTIGRKQTKQRKSAEANEDNRSLARIARLIKGTANVRV